MWEFSFTISGKYSRIGSKTLEEASWFSEKEIIITEVITTIIKNSVRKAKSWLNMFFLFDADLKIFDIACINESPSFLAIHKIHNARKISTKWKFLEFRMLLITGVMFMIDSMLVAKERK